MGRMIVKPRRDADLYVEWSSVVDAPTRWGPRADMEQYLTDHYRGPLQSDGDLADQVHSILARVDQYGTSALARGGGGWDDAGFIVMNVAEGWLPRERLYEFMERLTAEESVDDLLDPFEDE